MLNFAQYKTRWSLKAEGYGKNGKEVCYEWKVKMMKIRTLDKD